MSLKLKLGHKMALGFAILIAIIVIVGGVASWTMRYCSTTARTLVEQDVNVIQIQNNVADATSGLKLNARSYGLSGNASYLDKVAGYEGSLKTALKKGEELIALHPGMEGMNESITQTNKAIEDFDEALKETREAQEIINDSAGAKFNAAEDLTASLNSLVADQEKKGISGNASIADTQQSVAKTTAIAEIGIMIGEIRASTLKGQLDHDPKPLADADVPMAAIEKRLEELGALIADPAVAAKLQVAQSQAQAFRKATVRVLAGMIAMQEAYAHRAKTYGELDTAVDGISQYSRDHLAASATSVSQSLAFGMILTIGGMFSALVVGVVVAYGVTRSITRSINPIISSLGLGAEQTLYSAEQVSAASQSLAQGASQQAASLEETSSSIEQMSSMTRKNADAARQASVLSAEMKSSADKGNSAMTLMGQAIGEIQKASSETAKIVKTIDEIAFQTNLLALNAAVEAARAGEAGKGFAVVAEEVRNLAMRSADAAKTTSLLIDGSVASAKNGVMIAQEAGTRITEIQQAVEKVNAIITEIAAASLEQSQGIEQVNQAVQRIDKITQSNAAGAEESAAAAEELSSQSEQVRMIVKELSILVSGAVIHDQETERQADKSAVRSMRMAAEKRHRPIGAKTRRSVMGKETAIRQNRDLDQDFSDFDVAA